MNKKLLVPKKKQTFAMKTKLLFNKSSFFIGLIFLQILKVNGWFGHSVLI